MSKRYAPDTGDIIHLHFELSDQGSADHYKPALVLSPIAYNRKTGLMVCCAITPHIKGYPFEVPIGPELQTAVLADQVKSINWAGSKISLQGRVSTPELAQVRAKLLALISKA